MLAHPTSTPPPAGRWTAPGGCSNVSPFGPPTCGPSGSPLQRATGDSGAAHLCRMVHGFPRGVVRTGENESAGGGGRAAATLRTLLAEVAEDVAAGRLPPLRTADREVLRRMEGAADALEAVAEYSSPSSAA